MITARFGRPFFSVNMEIHLVIVAIHIVLMQIGVDCLKMIKMHIPKYTTIGDSTILKCQFDLEKDRLYSVTWYKDHEEFYRYVPGRRPQQYAYRVEGFTVDHQDSDSQQVSLHSINLRARGNYRCEVSAEAPSFTSIHGEGRMEVVALPKEGPQISGEDTIYKVGDVVSLNCTSDKSFPPGKLKWYVNDFEVNSEFEDYFQQPPHGLITSVAGLRFEVGPEHVSSTGQIQIRCVSTISLQHKQLISSNQQQLNQHSQSFTNSVTSNPLVDNREALLYVLHADYSKSTSLRSNFNQNISNGGIFLSAILFYLLVNV